MLESVPNVKATPEPRRCVRPAPAADAGRPTVHRDGWARKHRQRVGARAPDHAGHAPRADATPARPGAWRVRPRRARGRAGPHVMLGTRDGHRVEFHVQFRVVRRGRAGPINRGLTRRPDGGRGASAVADAPSAPARARSGTPGSVNGSRRRCPRKYHLPDPLSILGLARVGGVRDRRSGSQQIADYPTQGGVAPVPARPTGRSRRRAGLAGGPPRPPPSRRLPGALPWSWNSAR